MSDRGDDWFGPTGGRDGGGGEPPGPLPPIGGDRDPDPTRIMPEGAGMPGPPPPPGADDPTVAMPPGAVPPGGPFDPGPPYGGEPGDEFGDEEPEWVSDEQPWYRQPGPLAALIAGLAAVVLGVIALLVWTSDDGDDADDTLPAPSLASTTTMPATSSSVATTPPSTSPPTQATTTSSTTTTTPTTVAPSTTAAPSTQAPTTTTTTQPPTTAATPTTQPPPPPTTPAPTAATTTTIPAVTVPPQPESTVWDVIDNSPDLSQLRDAIESADLVGLVDGDQLITVLAPSNAAFDLVRAAPGGQELLDDPEQLRALLERHVIAADLPAGDLLALDSIETIGGDVLDIADNQIEDATILVGDVTGANGFLHVIDRVLLP